MVTPEMILNDHTQPTFDLPELTIKTLEEGVKYIQN